MDKFAVGFAPALGREPGETKTPRTMPRRVLDGNIRVRYFSDDVTVRYFTHQPPPQRVPDGNIRVRYISEDVTVRYFLPHLAVALPSPPNGGPAQSMTRRGGSSILTDVTHEVPLARCVPVEFRPGNLEHPEWNSRNLIPIASVRIAFHPIPFHSYTEIPPKQPKFG